MAARAGLQNEDMEFVQFHPTGEHLYNSIFKKGGKNAVVNICVWYYYIFDVCLT